MAKKRNARCPVKPDEFWWAWDAQQARWVPVQIWDDYEEDILKACDCDASSRPAGRIVPVSKYTAWRRIEKPKPKLPPPGVYWAILDDREDWLLVTVSKRHVLLDGEEIEELRGTHVKTWGQRITPPEDPSHG